MDTILRTSAGRTPRLERAWESAGRAAFAALAACVSTVLVWRERSRARRRLASLDDRMLRDIGLDRAAIWAESQKPFFRN